MERSEEICLPRSRTKHLSLLGAHIRGAEIPDDAELREWAETLPRRQAARLALQVVGAAEWARPTTTCHARGQRWIADRYLEQPHRARFDRLVADRRRDAIVVTERAALSVALLALAFGSDTAPVEEAGVLAKQLVGTMLDLDHRYVAEAAASDDQLIQYREQVFFGRHAERWSFLTAFELFVELLGSDEADRWPAIVAGLSAAEESLGFTVEEALLFGFAFSNAILHRPDPRVGEIDMRHAEESEWVLHAGGNLDGLVAWVGRHTISPEDLSVRDDARADVDVGSGWSFRIFYERPLVEFRPDRYLLVRETYLRQQATGEGLFWRVRNELSGSEGDRFIEAFGDPFEQRVHDLIRRTNPNTIFRDSDDHVPLEDHPRATRICDVIAITGDDTVVLAEAKLASAPIGMRIGGVDDGLDKYFTRLVDDAMTQLNDTALRLNTTCRMVAIAVVAIEAIWSRDHERRIAELWQDAMAGRSQDVRLGVDVPFIVVDLAELTLLSAFAAKPERTLGSVIVEFDEWRQATNLFHIDAFNWYAEVFNWPRTAGELPPTGPEIRLYDWANKQGSDELVRMVSPHGSQ